MSSQISVDFKLSWNVKYSQKPFFPKKWIYLLWLELCTLFLIICDFRNVLTSFFSDFHLVAILPCLTLCFPGGSEIKASASNAGDLGSIPGSGRSPGESHGQRSLVGYSPQGRKELDTTERLHFYFLSLLSLLCGYGSIESEKKWKQKSLSCVRLFVTPQL